METIGSPLLWTAFAVVVVLALLVDLVLMRHGGPHKVTFKEAIDVGALVTFLVTVAGIPVFNIGAPFWALIAGTLVSLMLERADWKPAAPRA